MVVAVGRKQAKVQVRKNHPIRNLHLRGEHSSSRNHLPTNQENDDQVPFFRQAQSSNNKTTWKNQSTTTSEDEEFWDSEPSGLPEEKVISSGRDPEKIDVVLSDEEWKFFISSRNFVTKSSSEVFEEICKLVGDKEPAPEVWEALRKNIMYENEITEKDINLVEGLNKSIERLREAILNVMVIKKLIKIPNTPVQKFVPLMNNLRSIRDYANEILNSKKETSDSIDDDLDFNIKNWSQLNEKTKKIVCENVNVGYWNTMWNELSKLQQYQETKATKASVDQKYVFELFNTMVCIYDCYRTQCNNWSREHYFPTPNFKSLDDILEYFTLVQFFYGYYYGFKILEAYTAKFNFIKK